MDRQSLIFSGAVAGGLATLLGGGLLVWRWWKTHQSGHAHKHGHSLFNKEDMVEKWMGFQYESPSEYNMTFSFASENALDFPQRCAELCKKHKNVSIIVNTNHTLICPIIYLHRMQYFLVHLMLVVL